MPTVCNNFICIVYYSLLPDLYLIILYSIVQHVILLTDRCPDPTPCASRRRAWLSGTRLAGHLPQGQRGDGEGPQAAPLLRRRDAGARLGGHPAPDRPQRHLRAAGEAERLLRAGRGGGGGGGVPRGEDARGRREGVPPQDGEAEETESVRRRGGRRRRGLDEHVPHRRRGRLRQAVRGAATRVRWPGVRQPAAAGRRERRVVAGDVRDGRRRRRVRRPRDVDEQLGAQPRGGDEQTPSGAAAWRRPGAPAAAAAVRARLPRLLVSARVRPRPAEAQVDDDPVDRLAAGGRSQLVQSARGDQFAAVAVCEPRVSDPRQRVQLARRGGGGALRRPAGEPADPAGARGGENSPRLPPRRLPAHRGGGHRGRGVAGGPLLARHAPRLRLPTRLRRPARRRRRCRRRHLPTVLPAPPGGAAVPGVRARRPPTLPGVLREQLRGVQRGRQLGASRSLPPQQRQERHLVTAVGTTAPTYLDSLADWPKTELKTASTAELGFIISESVRNAGPIASPLSYGDR